MGTEYLPWIRFNYRKGHGNKGYGNFFPMMKSQLRRCYFPKILFYFFLMIGKHYQFWAPVSGWGYPLSGFKGNGFRIEWICEWICNWISVLVVFIQFGVAGHNNALVYYTIAYKLSLKSYPQKNHTRRVCYAF